MAFELESWVGSLGLSEADKAAVLKSFATPDVLKKLEGSILTQSEFSRKMDELKNKEIQLERDYQKKVADEDQFRESVVGWKTQKEQEIEGRVTAAREEAARQLNAARDRIRQLATAHGIPDDEIKDLIPASSPTPTTRDPQPRGDDGKYMKLEDFRREAEAYALLPGLTVTLNTEYFRLFGNDAPPPAWEKVVEEARRTKRPYAEVFATMYKLPEKRAEIAKFNHDKELDDARKAGAEAERSKIMAEHPEYSARPSEGRGERSSPVLTLARQQMKDGPPKEVKDPNRAAHNAAAAWNEGKYREGNAA